MREANLFLTLSISFTDIQHRLKNARADVRGLIGRFENSSTSPLRQMLPQRNIQEIKNQRRKVEQNLFSDRKNRESVLFYFCNLNFSFFDYFFDEGRIWKIEK